MKFPLLLSDDFSPCGSMAERDQKTVVGWGPLEVPTEHLFQAFSNCFPANPLLCSVFGSFPYLLLFCLFVTLYSHTCLVGPLICQIFHIPWPHVLFRHQLLSSENQSKSFLHPLLCANALKWLQDQKWDTWKQRTPYFPSVQLSNQKSSSLRLSWR